MYILYTTQNKNICVKKICGIYFIKISVYIYYYDVPYIQEFESYDVPIHTATHCNTLQHTAAQCSTVQHIATHGNTLQHTSTRSNTVPIHIQICVCVYSYINV